MRNKRKGYQTIIQAYPDPRCIVSNAIEPVVTDRREEVPMTNGNKY